MRKHGHLFVDVVVLHDIERVIKKLDYMDTPTPSFNWFDLPDVGHIVATCYQCVFVVIDSYTFLPFVLNEQTDPSSLPICCVAHLPSHFVSVRFFMTSVKLMM